jgi:hypothetical protein
LTIAIIVEGGSSSRHTRGKEGRLPLKDLDVGIKTVEAIAQEARRTLLDAYETVQRGSRLRACGGGNRRRAATANGLVAVSPTITIHISEKGETGP